ncbi:hypothetical protein O0L34_g5545 [Tuta absoluta]|nr:hypothetical protein O0L34_g5545 [Tuta absoluta]
MPCKPDSVLRFLPDWSSPACRKRFVLFRYLAQFVVDASLHSIIKLCGIVFKNVSPSNTAIRDLFKSFSMSPIPHRVKISIALVRVSHNTAKPMLLLKLAKETVLTLANRNIFSIDTIKSIVWLSKHPTGGG